MKPILALLLLMLSCRQILADETNLTLTVDKEVYSNVTFVTATPYAVSISHSKGIASIPLAKLPPDLQQRFGYDPKKATDYYQKAQAQQAAYRPDDRRAVDTLNFGDSEAVVLEKLVHSTKIKPSFSDPKDQAVAIKYGGLNGNFRITVNTDLIFPLYFEFLDNRLSDISIHSWPELDASWYETRVKRAWKDLRDLAISRFGQPTKSNGYPAISEMVNGHSVRSDTWELQSKTVRLAVAEHNAEFYATLKLTDKALAAEQKARADRELNATKKSAAEGF